MPQLTGVLLACLSLIGAQGMAGEEDGDGDGGKRRGCALALAGLFHR